MKEAIVALNLILAGVLGYLVGAIPTGFFVCRALRGVDIYEEGSGHTGGFNVSRTAGFWAGVLTVIIDTILGIAAVLIAMLLTNNTWAAAAAGVMAIIGHNWSVYIHFNGGIGLSTTLGSLGYLFPMVTLISLVIVFLIWIVLVKLLHVHRARSMIFVILFLGPLLLLLGLPLSGILLGFFGSLAVIVKTIPDWKRKYS